MPLLFHRVRGRSAHLGDLREPRAQQGRRGVQGRQGRWLRLGLVLRAAHDVRDLPGPGGDQEAQHAHGEHDAAGDARLLALGAVALRELRDVLRRSRWRGINLKEGAPLSWRSRRCPGRERYGAVTGGPGCASSETSPPRHLAFKLTSTSRGGATHGHQQGHPDGRKTHQANLQGVAFLTRPSGH